MTFNPYRKLKMLYVAGPLSDKRGAYWVGENIRASREVMLELVRMGFAAISPHMNGAYCTGALPDEVVWLDVDCEIISRCDGVVFLPGWPQSEGSCCEREFAINNGIPCFDWTSESHRRFLEMSANQEASLWDLAECEGVECA